jgi:hypothetical protein
MLPDNYNAFATGEHEILTLEHPHSIGRVVFGSMEGRYVNLQKISDSLVPIMNVEKRPESSMAASAIT